MIKKFNLLFLTFFMIGKIKYAPGTIASLITCIVFFLLINTFDLDPSFFLKRLTKCLTFIFCFKLGPNLHGSEKSLPFF